MLLLLLYFFNLFEYHSYLYIKKSFQNHYTKHEIYIMRTEHIVIIAEV